ncbi:S8 family peptidase [Paenibacillus filicis]|uniref:S8 family peptidase n=2 Tax=Paenibacillus gyeongsangnamensis TaxID=3388067 RepID=A0ABT4QCI8_9BACL|nr:S8 family peptidase [Paenibacillus filicis]MCZ8514590.1 S8 family peptidase [Paenibacillus filicis]
MQGSDRADRRHIIRFGTERDFALFTRLLGKGGPAISRSGFYPVQPLHNIRAISVPLRSPAKLASLPFVHSIEPDIRIRVHHALPRKRSVTQNAGIVKQAPRIPWGIKHIRAPLAWRKSQGDRIRIGVIDTGADYSHPDLRHCLSRGVNVLNRQLLPIDDNGHGTHIAGTIAAFTLQKGIIGVAPQAIIHPVKAFDHQGGAFVSDIISGIDWCVRNGVDIINMSFGMKTYSKALEDAVLNAYREGVIIVASSGNEGKQADVDYPARFKQVIAVGATTRKGRIAPFSNSGKKIDIYAPGEKIVSTWLRGQYHELSGTSMATSHVSGVIALMLARRPDLRPRQVKTILSRHARMILKPGKRMGGAKEIHALRAVSAVMAKS